MIQTRLLLITSFVTGTVLMAVEMIGSRVLAPFFGNSIYVWGNLIGVILLAMSIGYFLGGKIADRESTQRDLYLIILGAAIYILATLFFYKPLLVALVRLGPLYGSMFSSVLLFAIPLLLLSFVPPYIIKLVAKKTPVGSSVGMVNSISTIGNIFGVYFATFVMIPQIGSRLALEACFIVLLLISIVGLVQVNWKYVFLGLIALLVMVTPTHAAEEGVLLETESMYNHIHVQNVSNEIRLFLNTDEYLSSVFNVEYYVTGRYYGYFMLMPLVKETENLLILGMGAGTSVDQFNYYFPEIKIDAVEIDEKVVEVAKEYFNLEESDKIHVFVEDARPFLISSNKKYDAIELDVFQHSIYIPFYVVTHEFFELVDRNLVDDGILMMNVFNPTHSRLLVERIENTMLTVFPSVFEFTVGPNTILLISKQDLNVDQLDERLNQKLDSDEDMPAILREIIEVTEFKRIEYDENIPIFTDDLAPVEEITKNLYG